MSPLPGGRCQVRGVPAPAGLPSPGPGSPKRRLDTSQDHPKRQDKTKDPRVPAAEIRRLPITTCCSAPRLCSGYPRRASNGTQPGRGADRPPPPSAEARDGQGSGLGKVPRQVTGQPARAKGGRRRGASGGQSAAAERWQPPLPSRGKEAGESGAAAEPGRSQAGRRAGEPRRQPLALHSIAAAPCTRESQTRPFSSAGGGHRRGEERKKERKNRRRGRAKLPRANAPRHPPHPPALGAAAAAGGGEGGAAPRLPPPPGQGCTSRAGPSPPRLNFLVSRRAARGRRGLPLSLPPPGRLRLLSAMLPPRQVWCRLRTP